MREGRITRHYGFGAARIGLCPEPYLSEPDGGFADTLARALRQRGQGRGGLGKDLANLAPAAVLALILLLAFVLTFAQSHRDDPEIDLVLLASQTLPLEQPVPFPEPPVVEPPRPEPPPLVAEPPAPKPPPPAAKPPPQLVKPPPPPPPVARPKPPPALATPKLPQQAPPTRPRNAPRPDRAPRTRPKPPVAVPALAAAPQAASPSRASRTRPRAASPERRTAAPPPALSAPQAQPDFQVARAPSRGARPARPLPATPARRLALPVAHAGAPAEEPMGAPRPGSQRMARTAPAPTASGRPRPQLALPSAATGAAPAASVARVARADAPTPSQPPAKGRSEDPRLAGVPLASLASCVTDREEDGLKRRVIAAVGSSSECISPAGRYRFIETKNLNAFLIWVERSSSREKADRCAELSLALECLDQRRARRGRGSRG